MIIFGWRSRFKTLYQEWTVCPWCKREGWLVARSLRTWFTLFFIPVLPLKLLGVYVECTSCGLAAKLQPADAAEALRQSTARPKPLTNQWPPPVANRNVTHEPAPTTALSLDDLPVLSGRGLDRRG
jgi:hypothetical protein